MDMIEPWADRLVGTRCEYPSFLSADGFPAEFSISWRRGVPEVRVLFESLGAEPTAWSAQEAGRALTRKLARRDGVDLRPYLAVEDLFVTDDPKPYRPTVWHSLAWRPGEAPKYKVYLNPQVAGPGTECDTVGEAMARLGLGAAWEPLARDHGALLLRGHQVEFFALDLCAGSGARAKVYFRHGWVPPAELGAVAAYAERNDAARAAEAIRLVYPGAGLVTNEPMTCLAFRRGGTRPQEANLYLRLPGATRSDAEAAARVAALLRAEDIDPGPHAAVLRALVPAALETTTGVQELLSYRTTEDSGQADVGLYLRFGVYDRPVQAEAAVQVPAPADGAAAGAAGGARQALPAATEAGFGVLA